MTFASDSKKIRPPQMGQDGGPTPSREGKNFIFKQFTR